MKIEWVLGKSFHVGRISEIDTKNNTVLVPGWGSFHHRQITKRWVKRKPRSVWINVYPDGYIGKQTYPNYEEAKCHADTDAVKQIEFREVLRVKLKAPR